MTTPSPESRAAAQRAVDSPDAAPENWFEDVYAASDASGAGVPWARLEPSIELLAWLEAERPRGDGQSVVVVGCGLGDDAEELARRGFVVTAFDVAESAIALCRERFPGSRVAYRAADLFALPAAWLGAFDLVCEHRTVQSLPPAWQDRGMAAIAGLCRPGGTVVVIVDFRPAGAEKSGPPWRLRPEELAGFAAAGLQERSCEELPVANGGGRTRATVVYERPQGSPP